MQGCCRWNSQQWATLLKIQALGFIESKSFKNQLVEGMISDIC